MVPSNTTDKADFGFCAVTHKVTRLSTIVASHLPVPWIYEKVRNLRILSTLSTILKSSMHRRRMRLLLGRLLQTLSLTKQLLLPRGSGTSRWSISQVTLTLVLPSLTLGLRRRIPWLILLNESLIALRRRAIWIALWRRAIWLRMPNPVATFCHGSLEHLYVCLLRFPVAPNLPKANPHWRLINPI